MINVPPPYDLLDNLDALPREFIIGDHMGGFQSDLSNYFLDQLDQYAGKHGFVYRLHVDEFFLPGVKSQYPNLNFVFSMDSFSRYRGWGQFKNYNMHSALDYKNFICSFNGTEHVSRKLLVAIIKKFGWYDTTYSSKNIVFDVDEIDGHLKDLTGDQSRFYRKFFISNDSKDFFQSINSFGHVRSQHFSNIHTLEHKLTHSFLHLVSETLATSHQPFVTEKFLYSVVTRGLFLAYAPVGWHQHLEHYYGFKPYAKIFDYKFDSVANHVERLIELTCMISKFSQLSIEDWTNLYEMELEIIEYNYDWYRSNNYIKHMQQFF
jgi:hypothetical protein